MFTVEKGTKDVGLTLEIELAEDSVICPVEAPV
jgi:hypothetical protein